MEITLKTINVIVIILGINLAIFQLSYRDYIIKDFNEQNMWMVNEAISNARDYNELTNIINSMRK